MLQIGAAGTAVRPADTVGGNPLKGKKIYIPPMAYGSARAFAAGFRAIGLDAEPTPPPTTAPGNSARATPPATSAIRPRSRSAIS